MTNRRRYQRFVVGSPWQGTLRIGRDAAITRSTGGIVTVATPGMDGQFFSMRMEWDDEAVAHSVRVWPIDVRTIFDGGAIWSEMHLAPGSSSARERQAFAGLADNPPRHIRLVREVPVETWDFGRGGVLMDTAMPVDAGAVGWLAVASPDGEFWSDDVRVCRALTVRRSGFPCRVGAELLAMREPDSRSLRAAFQHLESQLGFETQPSVQGGGQHVAVARSIRS